MPQIRFSRRAQADLQNINGYTIATWCREQATAYIDSLESTVKQLASTPKIAKPCDDLGQGLRAFPHPSHVIYFMEEKKGIVIARVLHERMRAELHL